MNNTNLQERKHAEVIAYFDIKENYNLFFVIENIGEIPAKNVQLRFLGDTIFDEGSDFEISPYVFRHGISFIPPKKQYRCHFAFLEPLFFEKPETLRVEVAVNYKDRNQSYNEIFPLDLNIFEDFR